MDYFMIGIWGFVVIAFVIMIIIIIKGGNAWIYVFDEHNGITRVRGKVRDDAKVAFTYNASTKGGVAIENNKYKQGKKLAFFYRDVGGILLPINDQRIQEKVFSLDLSTSQEKLYETMALENVAKKIDNTWWNQIKPLIFGFLILLVAMIVSIVMLQYALNVEPIPEPQVEIWKDTNANMIRLVESNEKLVSTIIAGQTAEEQTTPR